MGVVFALIAIVFGEISLIGLMDIAGTANNEWMSKNRAVQNSNWAVPEQAFGVYMNMDIHTMMAEVQNEKTYPICPYRSYACIRTCRTPVSRRQRRKDSSSRGRLCSLERRLLQIVYFVPQLGRRSDH